MAAIEIIDRGGRVLETGSAEPADVESWFARWLEQHPAAERETVGPSRTYIAGQGFVLFVRPRTWRA